MMRAGTIVSRHRLRSEKYLKLDIMVEYLREVDDLFYNGTCGRRHDREIHREVERFLLFAKTGTVNLPNPIEGCRQKLNAYFRTIAERFIETDPNLNSRNDAG